MPLDDLLALPRTPAGVQRGDRPDHGRDHRAGRGGARGAGARRALRPTQGRRTGSPATRRRRTSREHSTSGSRSSVPVLGHGVLHRARRRRQRGDHLWARREELCAAINEQRREPRLPAGHRAARRRSSATHDPEKAAAGADVVVLAVPSQTLRANLDDWARCMPDDAVLVSLMKGVELGTLKRMSEVIAEVTGAGPDRIAVVSGPNLAKEIARREPAASVVACADEDVAKLAAGPHATARRSGPTPRSTCVGCELGGAYKNVVAPRGRHGRRARLRRQHHRLGDHPRPGRDRPAGDGARRQPDDADGPGRARRPGRHLLLAAVAQPHVRREARPGHDDRGDLRLHPPGRRGREVLRVAARARRPRRASTRRSPRPSTRSSTAR